MQVVYVNSGRNKLPIILDHQFILIILLGDMFKLKGVSNLLKMTQDVVVFMLNVNVLQFI